MSLVRLLIAFRYIHEASNQKNSVLEFMLELDGVTINDADMIRWDEQGRIVDFKIMLRPYKAIELVRQKMQAMLQKQ